MSRKPTIAIDVDDVLAASAEGWVSYSNQQWGTRLTIEDYQEDWAAMWQVDHETMKQRAEDLFASDLVSTFKHRPDALEVLQKLSQRFELVIATSRHRRVHDQTLAWLDKYYGGIFANMHMAGIFDDGQVGSHLRTKAELIRGIEADYLIDDQPKHCNAVALDGKQAVLFGDYAWNRDAEVINGVARCLDWPAVEAYFNGIS